MARILDGRSLAEEIKDRVSADVGELADSGVEVGLGLLRAGDEPSSAQYYHATLKACRRTGIRAHEFSLPGDVSANELLNVVHAVNKDERINGLLVLFPLPGKINSRRIVNEIAPEKDVDGLGYLSIGRLAAEESTHQLLKEALARPVALPRASGFLPCTPFGVIRLMEHYEIRIRGRHAVVIGKSLAVGKPLCNMLLAKEATVTVCHRETRDLEAITRQADILCSATGVRDLVRGGMVKEGAVVVDIGINVLPGGEIVGDVDFEAVEKKASYITPVPGGVGPLTIAMLLENTVRSARMEELAKSPPSG